MHRSFEEYHSQRGRDHGQLRVFLPNPSRRRAKRDSQQTGTIHKLRRFRLGHYTKAELLQQKLTPNFLPDEFY